MVWQCWAEKGGILAGRVKRIVVSNGFGRFHLRLAASEIDSRGYLELFITAGYPSAALLAFARFFGVGQSAAVQRLFAREAGIDRRLIKPAWLAELVCQIAQTCRSIGRCPTWLAERFDLWSRRLYIGFSRRIVRRLTPGAGDSLYHYRAGFGGSSVELARDKGWTCLCDHSIAHPGVLDHLLEHGGRVPVAGKFNVTNKNWAQITADIDRSDHVLVNSDFVKQTMTLAGWPQDRVHVVYLGVDDAFLELIPNSAPEPHSLRFLFAGTFGHRKGATALTDAFLSFDEANVALDICGPVENASLSKFRHLLADPRTQSYGNLKPGDLAARMAKADVFVFPSLAEGSARVVSEALAAGCYVITTPNAGSIVEDGVHGQLVSPSDPSDLLRAFQYVSRNRNQVREIGKRNADLIHGQYRQSQYGEKLLELYNAIV